jgi:hypothetical protein
MKDLTKEELELLVRESNKDILDELTYDDEEKMALINKYETYAQFVTQAKALLDQMAKAANIDYTSGNLSRDDVMHLIDNELGRAYTAVDGAVNTLRAVIGPGLKTQNIPLVQEEE